MHMTSKNLFLTCKFEQLLPPVNTMFLLAKFPINKVKRSGNCSKRFLKQFNSRISFFHQVESHVVKIMINNNNNDDDE